MKLEQLASDSRNGLSAMFLTDVFKIDPSPKQLIINQSNFYSANILGEARFSGAAAKSRKPFRNINRPWGMTVAIRMGGL